MSGGPKPFEHGGDLNKMRRAISSKKDENGFASEILDFSSNINPLGPSLLAPTLASFSTGDISRYPDPQGHILLEAASKRFGMPLESIIAGNGSSELFFLFTQHFARHKSLRRALIVAPSYSDYERASLAANLQVDYLYLKEENGFALDFDELASTLQGGEIVFLGSPNNPTGISPDHEKLGSLVKAHPDTIFFVDEAFRFFHPGGGSLVQNPMPENLVVFHSLTKFYAMAGLRAGLAFACPQIISAVQSIQPGWPLNIIAARFAGASLQDREYEERTVEYITRARAELVSMLQETKLFGVYPSEANYLLLRCQEPYDQNFWYEKLLENDIAIRRCSNFPGLNEKFIRVAVKSNEQNQRLVQAICEIAGGPLHERRHASQERKVPALMVGGASSHAGKTLLAAALCRILTQDGFRVRPFKAQNMSLNSYVTPHGEEVSRAQCLQARAAGVEIDVRMNPVLLKPMGSQGSDVVVLGKSTGRADFHSYKNRRDEIFSKVQEAYDSLSREADVMILEGAGSIAEINLKKNDIVNMKMAEYAGARVLLVADIDRGGIFASLLGTLDLLTPPERERVCGLVVNKFRGDVTLFQEGVAFLESRGKKPVAGVIPWFDIAGLPEEDSLGLDRLGAGGQNSHTPPEQKLSIGVVRLPHISNYTDFDALLQEPDVTAEYTHSGDFEKYDLVILPGSRNVISDMKWLKEKKIDLALQEFAASGKFIAGICGGYQLLGQKIFDPHQVETGGEEIDALGLLTLETTLEKEKLLGRFQGVHQASGLSIGGYEIHHGVTRALPLAGRLSGQPEREDHLSSGGAQTSVAAKTMGEPSVCECIERSGELNLEDHSPEKSALLGAANESGKVWGAYIHGIFDNDDFRRWYLNEIRRDKNLAPIAKPALWNLDEKLDELADAVRNNIDMDLIYRELGLEKK